MIKTLSFSRVSTLTHSMCIFRHGSRNLVSTSQRITNFSLNTHWGPNSHLWTNGIMCLTKTCQNFTRMCLSLEAQELYTYPNRLKIYLLRTTNLRSKLRLAASWEFLPQSQSVKYASVRMSTGQASMCKLASTVTTQSAKRMSRATSSSSLDS